MFTKKTKMGKDALAIQPNDIPLEETNPKPITTKGRRLTKEELKNLGANAGGEGRLEQTDMPEIRTVRGKDYYDYPQPHDLTEASKRKR